MTIEKVCETPTNPPHCFTTNNKIIFAVMHDKTWQLECCLHSSCRSCGWYIIGILSRIWYSRWCLSVRNIKYIFLHLFKREVSTNKLRDEITASPKTKKENRWPYINVLRSCGYPIIVKMPASTFRTNLNLEAWCWTSWAHVTSSKMARKTSNERRDEHCAWIFTPYLIPTEQHLGSIHCLLNFSASRCVFRDKHLKRMTQRKREQHLLCQVLLPTFLIWNTYKGTYFLELRNDNEQLVFEVHERYISVTIFKANGPLKQKQTNCGRTRLNKHATTPLTTALGTKAPAPEPLAHLMGVSHCASFIVKVRFSLFTSL